MKQSLVKKLTAGILTGALAICETACGVNSADTNNASTNADVSAETENSGDVTVINAVTGGSPKPYISVEEDGSYSGYDIEVLQAVFDRLPQYSLNLQTAEFDAIFSGLTAGNYQIAVNNFSYNEKRAESYYYSFPYDEIKYVFVQRADDEPLTSLQDAADRGYSTFQNTFCDLSVCCDLTIYYQHTIDGYIHNEVSDQCRKSCYLFLFFCHTDGHTYCKDQRQVIKYRASDFVHNDQECM